MTIYAIYGHEHKKQSYSLGMQTDITCWKIRYKNG